MQALIFGVTGQDGSFLSELLLSKDYKVIGAHRRSSTTNFQRIDHLLNEPNFSTVECDLTDAISVSGVIQDYKPDECYNLAAMSHVATSFKQPAYTSAVNYTGVQYILDSIVSYSPNTKLYQASSSEQWGNNYKVDENGRKYQDEWTPFSPASPYAVSKVAAHNLVNNYREAYGIFACSGLLHNHESKRRGEHFVTRKITKWIGKFKNKWDNDEYYAPHGVPILDDKEKLRLGNIESFRDWGHAKDYVRAMHLMLQQDKPDDFVIATGETHCVKDLLKVAFGEIGISDWESYIIIDKEFYRPSDVDYLLGDASKARRELGWKPEITFEQLIKEMVAYDIQDASKNM